MEVCDFCSESASDIKFSDEWDAFLCARCTQEQEELMQEMRQKHERKRVMRRLLGEIT